MTCVVDGDWSECSVPALFTVAGHAAQVHKVDRRQTGRTRQHTDRLVRRTESAAASVTNMD